jgi:Leucine-rich repeat (LRR) protein
MTMVEIPPILLHLPHLSTFDLSSNPIRSLDRLWEADLPSLHELNLSACWLRSLPYGAPKFATTLNVLVLDGNFLGRVCPNFSVFVRLRTLSLVGNDFMQIPQLPPSLQVLIFRMNSFSEVPPSSLSELDTGYCDVQSRLAIHSQLHLHHCGLSGHLQLWPLPLLTFLDLSNNALSSLDVDSSRRLSELYA